ncbi:hypothetical protein CGCSCA5_v006434 [Colletotrichum siamense]|uniref:uncharacterized protein n=1 Tax=Colletotrichum siamense TaxID=690259 RepID=UPI0018727731|nr:uncharacterized protein CGCS363_v008506 [Colletotrichum siamense]KAF4816540.1 hypothetical protein CGCSCA5_v006434 [Colletotrichum siamense]KAF5497309.1 hypothetical protein CGCS363_v008506 [Colletotrichum siamense]
MAHRDMDVVMPWECRDVEDQAEAHFNAPLRSKNKALTDENARLKKLLRENGISWSPVSANYQKHHRPNGRRTRSSICSESHAYPYLPTEVLLRILKYSLTSNSPIIDPLSKLKPENLTAVERTRDNQIAIHFLATCKAMYEEGSRILWNQNSFVFTNPDAVRNFADLDFAYRKNVKHVNFRIIAQYFDDKRRKHKLDRSYHPSLKNDVTLRTIPRVNEHTYARAGFRCYTWGQVTDFLRALRAPYDPKHDKKLVRPRLFPNLESLRIDLVNFMDDFLPMPGSDLHDMASHELGCSLNELQVTGLPIDDAGSKATAELTGLLRDEGLFLAGLPSFVQLKNNLKALSGISSCARVVRAWKTLKPKKTEGDADDHDSDSDLDFDDHHHPREPIMPPAPRETGHPKSTPSRKDLTIWKRVPKTRDGDERQWTEFCRSSGYPMEDVEEYMSDDELGVCPCCGEPHPSLLELLEMEGDDDDEL